jgi:hypothetical protein
MPRSALEKPLSHANWRAACILGGVQHTTTFLAACLALLAAACGATSTELGGPAGVRCSASVSAPSGGVASTGGSLTIAVGAARDCTWAAASEASWLSVTPTEGQGEGAVQVTVAQNPQPSARTGRVVVDGTRVTITQAAAPCTLELNRTAASVPAAGGRVTVQVTGTSGCSWQATTGVPWIVASPAAGSGAGSVNLDVAPNPGGARSGTVVIAGTTVTVSQEATPAPPPPTDSPGTPGGPPPGGGTPVPPGDGTPPPADPVPDPEPPPPPRAAAPGTGPGRTTVPPPPPPCTVALSPAAHTVPADGTDASFLVVTEAHCDWTATSSAAWVTFRSATSGRGPGEVRYRVAANETSVSRTATITVAGQTHLVTQAAGRPRRVEVEGRVSDLSGTCPTSPSPWADGRSPPTRAREWDDGRCTDMRNGREVEVDGEVIGENQLWAREVEFD